MCIRDRNVENRSTNLAGQYRGTVAIHAGARYTNDREHAIRTIDRLAPESFGDVELERGAIIGLVDLVDVHFSGMECSRGASECHEYGLCSPWGEAYSYHLVLENPRPLAVPIPWTGGLGLRRFDSLLLQAKRLTY